MTVADLMQRLNTIWCPHQLGWRSQRGDGYSVSAELDGINVYYEGPTVEVAERAYYRACRRTVLRRFIPWLTLPPAEMRL